MKKTALFTLFAALIACVALTSCSAKSKLENACKEANKEMPLTIMEGLKMTDLVYEDNDMIYTVEVQEAIIGEEFIDLVNESKSEMKAVMLESIKSGGEDERELVKLCKESDTSIKFKFVGIPSKATAVITISPNEL